VPLGFGQGPGLSNYTLGQAGGTETIALSSTQLPQHSHTIDAGALTATPKCSNGVSDQRTPVGNVPAVEAAGVTATYSNAAPDANMNGAALVMGGAVGVANTGGGQPHENRQPHLALTYCIALTGIFPSPN
jgi:microcystin-dependent protein